MQVRRTVVSIAVLLELAVGSFSGCGDDTDPNGDAHVDSDADGDAMDAENGETDGGLAYPLCDPRLGAAACPTGERCALSWDIDGYHFSCWPLGTAHEGEACSWMGLGNLMYDETCLDGTACLEMAGSGQRCARVCGGVEDCRPDESCLLLHEPPVSPMPGFGLCRIAEGCDPLGDTGCPAGQRCHLAPTTDGSAVAVCDDEGSRGPGEACDDPYRMVPTGCAAGTECIRGLAADGTFDDSVVPRCDPICDPREPDGCPGAASCVALTAEAGLCTSDAPTTIDADRPARLFVPSAHDGTTPLPLVLALKGYDPGLGEQVDAFWRFRREAERVGAYLLLPDGTSNGTTYFWNATPACCDHGGTGVDDSTYLSGLVEKAAALYPIDRRRVFLFGFSNGGFMSYRLACEHADVFAAIASLAGSTFADEADCAGTGPVSVLQIHGTADTDVAYDGRAGRWPSAPETATRWATRAGCDLGAAVDGAPFDLVTDVAGDETTPRTWSAGCAPGIEVALWTMDGEGHVPAMADDFSTRVFDWLLSHPRTP